MSSPARLLKVASSRILTFDLLRGYFLVAIILDHLSYFPNGLDWMSGRGQLYVSAAEGFFLISGIVLGIVRGRKLIGKPFRMVATLLLKRGVQLYVTAVVLMLLFTFIGWLFLDNPGLKPGIRLPSENIFDIIWGGLTFEYIYGWADYLRLYAIFLFASPIAMWLLRKNLWYVVLGLSLYVWSLFDVSPLETDELSQVYSWQLIFFGGLTIGFYWDTICTWWSHLPRLARKSITTSTVIVAAITMLANIIWLVFGQAIIGIDAYRTIHYSLLEYFSKEELPIPRLLMFMVWFGAAFWLFHRYEKIIVRWLGKLLIPFGTNSLYVYTIHAFVVFFIHLLISQATSSWLLNLILTLSCVGLIWVAVHYKFLMSIIPR